jgi:hypothetical protein
MMGCNADNIALTPTRRGRTTWRKEKKGKQDLHGQVATADHNFPSRQRHLLRENASDETDKRHDARQWFATTHPKQRDLEFLPTTTSSNSSTGWKTHLRKLRTSARQFRHVMRWGGVKQDFQRVEGIAPDLSTERAVELIEMWITEKDIKRD